MDKGACKSIRISVVKRKGRYYVSSRDLPGLWLWGEDLDGILDDLGPTIKSLYKHGKGIEVEVREAISFKFLRWTLRFPKLGGHRIKVCEIYAPS